MLESMPIMLMKPPIILIITNWNVWCSNLPATPCFLQELGKRLKQATGELNSTHYLISSLQRQEGILSLAPCSSSGTESTDAESLAELVLSLLSAMVMMAGKVIIPVNAH